LKKRKDFWAEAIRNLRKARDQVARRYDAVRKATPFKVGDVVAYRVKVLSSKGKGVSAKLELKW
jgi:acyl dehydratase